MGRAAGAVVSFFVVAAILLNASVTLGLVVLIGVPAAPRPARPAAQAAAAPQHGAARDDGRAQHARPPTSSAGCGCCAGSAARRSSTAATSRSRSGCGTAGVRVAKLQSLLDALQVFLPGVFVVIVVWLGARFAVEGTITPGELVAFYGYSAFLMIPLRTGTEVANKLIRGLVAGTAHLPAYSRSSRKRRTSRSPRRRSTDGELVDVQSGLRVQPGSADRRRRRGARRVGSDRRPDRPLRRGPGAARRRLAVRPGARLRPPGDRGQRRERHLVQRTAARGARRPRHRDRRRHPGGDRARRRPTTSSRRSTTDSTRGRGARPVSFSGGQRQRLVLDAGARRPTADILVLVEPTSAVDAHTEARIAERLQRAPRRAHHGRSRPRARCCSTRPTRSPCSSADEVVATGSHRDLLDDPRYRRVVARGEDE